MLTSSYRKYLRTLVITCAVLLGGAAAAGTARVNISGTVEEIPAYQEKDITYISFSGLVEIIGGSIDWKVIGHQVDYVHDTNRFEFVIGSPFFKRNDSVFNMTFLADFKAGQLYLPAETFIPCFDQVLHQKLTWSKDSRTLQVESEYFNVTDMSFEAKANGLLVEIFLTGALAYDIFVTEGNWINVSIRDGRLNVPRLQSREDRRFMYDLKTHQQKETGQISFRLKRRVERWTHKIQEDPPRIQISIPDVTFDMAEVDTGARVGPDDKIDVIVIDPGHGGSHYGAIGQKGSREKDVALDIAKRLAKLIRKDKQFRVIMTRDRDQTVTLQERADIANKASADLFVSIHANSSTKRHIRGWNVFFLAPAKNDSARAVAQFENSAFFRDKFNENPDMDEDIGNSFDDPVLNILNEMIMTEFQAESLDLAMMVDREFRRHVKTSARGVDQAGFYVLNMVFAPSVLIETGFISNKQEEKILGHKDYQESVAQALYNAIKRFKAKYESQ